MFPSFDHSFTVLAAAVCWYAVGLAGDASASDAPPLPEARVCRVLMLSGPGDHDSQAATAFLRKSMAATGRFDVRVCEVAGGLKAQSLADFDVLVDLSGRSAACHDSEGEIARFVEAGKGLVITHGALAEEKPDAAARGCWPVALRGGSRSHPGVRFQEVHIVRPDHPVVRDIPARFKIADALPGGLIVQPGAEVIATARDETLADGGSADQPVLVAMQHGKGRVFCTALGHDLASMREPTFLATFLRGTEWAAADKVTLPANAGLPRPHAGAVKALLITGGHDHEASFYALFDGHDDLAAVPVSSSNMAFKSDLRRKYDVVIMYDFSRDLDETGKKNLRNFVESGKGVVVLHHGLLNYQDWTWWTHEVVGCSYRLSNDGGMASSTVKDNQQFFVTPEGGHPITAGIPPFHLVDEAYKRMWFSPGVRPLLTTDTPASDRILAWVGPTASYRVVAIQLGHGPSAYTHPVYKTLVHNAILWSAGKSGQGSER